MFQVCRGYRGGAPIYHVSPRAQARSVAYHRFFTPAFAPGDKITLHGVECVLKTREEIWHLGFGSPESAWSILCALGQGFKDDTMTDDDFVDVLEYADEAIAPWLNAGMHFKEGESLLNRLVILCMFFTDTNTFWHSLCDDAESVSENSDTWKKRREFLDDNVPFSMECTDWCQTGIGGLIEAVRDLNG